MPLEQLRTVNGIGRRHAAARPASTLLVASAGGPAMANTADAGAASGLRASAATQTPGRAPAERGGIRLASLDTGAAPAGRAGSASKTGTGARDSGADVQVLRRSSSAMTHTVKRGDTLFALARRYN